MSVPECDAMVAVTQVPKTVAFTAVPMETWQGKLEAFLSCSFFDSFEALFFYGTREEACSACLKHQFRRQLGVSLSESVTPAPKYFRASAGPLKLSLEAEKHLMLIKLEADVQAAMRQGTVKLAPPGSVCKFVLPCFTLEHPRNWQDMSISFEEVLLDCKVTSVASADGSATSAPPALPWVFYSLAEPGDTLSDGVKQCLIRNALNPTVLKKDLASSTLCFASHTTPALLAFFLGKGQGASLKVGLFQHCRDTATQLKYVGADTSQVTDFWLAAPGALTEAPVKLEIQTSVLAIEGMSWADLDRQKDRSTRAFLLLRIEEDIGQYQQLLDALRKEKVRVEGAIQADDEAEPSLKRKRDPECGPKSSQ